ncbi:2-amino-4-hydroxy-6-hydroxymethyldihydropteridine diphosphokinase [Propionibacterium australiense]|uniref:2-amino-4-hydroxy-6-hydroxymethyldihydropteridine diphosphokinase n=1 Tax=Propionibacterium australiense TaxID=119981 RepID=A0A383S6N4_9ACTN|nr:2-amino-4-hydroxy-6-hydroxymethyldihydropteridine diphosphokinase [Propionibacterium australiense]RLP09741.1 2-amino-4-hydroxy-6-hydroxymethyldihydropteridine diphosphokinase [Propionibacterium australiense]RLP10204.1 2-amino-4-hydroxy-6-hydroxymethyldihydropteridine diphosphokinase [Propionibacterium australiense]SYZ33212.1 2-amino-4-hydroxy-6-hydroxymethyldihydropteridinediphosphokinase [Propionibacterium australiense]VEH89315.1 2-amino-4-hydroxy-6-hydroxymethyldihydropteridinepyrophosphok
MNAHSGPEPGAPERHVVFSMGSNLGDPLANLRAGVRDLAGTPGIRRVRVSSVYRTRPVGNTAQDDFLNVVVTADSALDPLELLDRANAIEDAHGRWRDPDNPHGPRTLDIDLVMVGECSNDSQRLQLPHPRARGRAFVLVPWAELEPEAALPDGRITDLLSALDTSGVELAECWAWPDGAADTVDAAAPGID